MKIWLKAAVIAVCFLMSLAGESAFAETEVSWMVRKAVPVVPDRLIGCHGSFQTVEVEGVGWVEGCYVAGALRTVTYDTQGGTAIAVSKAPVGPLYPLNACGRRNGCEYLPGSDRLVELISAQPYAAVQIYDDISRKISLTIQPNGMRKYERLHDAHPHLVTDNAGYHISVNAFATSKNGRWLAVELPNKGTARIDLDTKAVRRVIAPGYEYGRGMDPIEQMAVSDDGRTIVVTGLAAGFSITQIDDQCGDIPVRFMEVRFAPAVRPCHFSDISIGANEGGFLAGYAPEFQSNTRLTVLISGRDMFRFVTIRPSTVPSHASLDYLAVGDSFSSGEGELDDSFYVPMTNTSTEKCHISRRSYPFLAAADRGFAGVRSVACSGARIGDVLGAPGYNGQQHRLAERANAAELVDAALAVFIPGRVAQADFVQTYTPKIVTIGIGGNDAGMMDKLQACAMPTECRWVSEEGKQQTLEEINRLQSHLTGLYESLQHRSPDTRMIVVGYPKILNNAGRCDLLTQALFTANERQYMTESLIHLNKVVALAAKTAGLPYVDIENVFSGAALCDEGTLKAMNGFRFGKEAGLVAALPALHFIGSETFHPTPYGHQLIARKVAEKLGDTSCQSCGEGASQLQTSEYWSSQQSPRVIPRLMKQEMTTDIHELLRTVTLPSFSFAPLSKVTLELYSQKRTLGEIAADEQGALTYEFTIPQSLEKGFHTLYAYGETDSGERVGYYQTIRYGEYEPRSAGATATSQTKNGEVIGVTPTTAQTPSVLAASTENKPRDSPQPLPLTDAIKTSTWYWLLPVFILLGIMTVWLVFARR